MASASVASIVVLKSSSLEWSLSLLSKTDSSGPVVVDAKSVSTPNVAADKKMFSFSLFPLVLLEHHNVWAFLPRETLAFLELFPPNLSFSPFLLVRPVQLFLPPPAPLRWLFPDGNFLSSTGVFESYGRLQSDLWLIIAFLLRYCGIPCQRYEPGMLVTHVPGIRSRTRTSTRGQRR